VKDSREAMPLLKGTLDLLCLKALSFGRTHGYGVARWLEQNSEGALDVEDSALYQALHRLAGKRLVEAEWGVTENNRRARYYRLTDKGRERLRDEARAWARYTRTVSAVLAIPPGS
jgi:PadR family transcriptional regulator PadR